MSGTTSAKPDYTLPYEQTVLSILRDFGIVRAQLFGSAARGELTPTNDIDLLTEPAELVGLVSFSYYGKDLKR